ncbi:hypothetical protein BDP81DRAFT_50542 [Colletotrichum phormii]|uniref:Secreted protein n=1 Tax=Colletotrichum phormii TaxID=359342 RepID=A0AAI9ZPE7_9PEZI|nr:uncharacterized protein BDP81DRAFT_50542 [Colletotrichum phormii]KAK1634623.1 hypothetical protein BDP81DRAFT_50542 [Colletotrichum phormii]
MAHYRCSLGSFLFWEGLCIVVQAGGMRPVKAAIAWRLSRTGCSPPVIATRRPDPCSYRSGVIGRLGPRIRCARRLRVDADRGSGFPRGGNIMNMSNNFRHG